MSGKYTIDSLEIEGFRGYLDEVKHGIHNRSSIIFGSQGSGKSSTLNAIEWCLFGRVAYFKSAESKSDAEIVNQRIDSREAKVKLSLTDGSTTVEVARSKTVNSRETNLIVNYKGKTEEGELAQETLFKALGLTFDDFYRSVYLHQESINALITDDPKIRDEAIDRLLGLERVRNITGSIPMQEIKKSLAELTSQKDKISTKLLGAIEQIAADVSRAENEAKRAGIEKDQISIGEISKRLTQLQTHFDAIATENQSEPFFISTDLTTETISRLVPKMKTFLRTCRKKVIDAAGVDELRTKEREAIELQSDSENLLKKKNERESKIKGIESVFGNLQTIENEIINNNKKIEDLNRERDELDAKVRLAKDALHFFEDSLISDCPVCGQKITYETTKKHLEEIIESVKSKRIDEIYNEISKIKAVSKELNNKKEELVELGKELEDVSKKIFLVESKCSLLAEREIKFDEIESFLNTHLSTIKKKIEESNKAFSTKNSHIENAETEVDRIQVINNALQKREEYEVVEKRSKEENEESKGLSQAIMEIEKFKDNLDVIVQSLNEIQSSSATESISKAKEKMASLYDRIMAHPYWNQLDISVTSKNVQGIQKNTYLIKARNAEELKDTYVSSRFSAGQLNCVALAIFLSLSELSQHNIGFMILDDPSQSLDDEHIKELSEVLSEFSKTRQVIISTQEGNLYGYLKSAFGNDRAYNEVKFLPWTRNGCRLVGGSE